MRLLVLPLLLALAWGQAWGGSTWYVRPAADCANNGNGTAYGCAASNGAAGAWRTMANVTWGVGNVDTGDTLKTCSSETSPFTTADYDGGGLAMLHSQQPGARVTGDCSAEGGGTVAYHEGAGTRDYGFYCATNAECLGQTWDHQYFKNFDSRGWYVRNDLSTTAAVNFTGDELTCDDILASSGTPQCGAGFGANVTLSNITSSRTSDDNFHWEGDNQNITNLTGVYPGYGQTGNFGDCYQCANNCDKVRLVGWYCDHRNLGSKQCVIMQANGGGGDADTVIADGVCLYPETGNATNLNKPIYSGVPGGRVERNYVLGGYFGIFVDGADTKVIGNVIVGAEYRGIDMASTVTTGTGTVAHNSVSDSGDGIVLNGGASVTNNVNNNLTMNNTKGCAKGGSSTLNQSYNAWYGNTTNSNNCGALTNGVTADPKLMGGSSPRDAEDFCLRPDSPLLAAGTYIGAWATGYNSEDLGKPPAIGARGLCNARRAITSRRDAGTRRAAAP